MIVVVCVILIFSMGVVVVGFCNIGIVGIDKDVGFGFVMIGVVLLYVGLVGDIG